MRGKGQQQKRFQPVYALQDSATGLYIKVIDGAEPQLARFDEATQYPATTEGRLSAYTAVPAGRAVELVRRDA